MLQEAYDNNLNVLLVGETGCGKTHAVRYLSYLKKVPYMRVSLNGASLPEDLIGQYVPDTDKQYGFKWQDGVLTRMIRYGGVFVCDEINAAPASILFVLHMLLDDERKIVLVQKNPPEVLHAHPHFRFMATMNPPEQSIYSGVKSLNAALQDRFDIVLHFKYNKSLQKKYVSEKMVSVVERIRIMIQTGIIKTPVSIRGLKQFARNVKIFGEEAALTLFINKFSALEAKAIAEVIRMEMSRK